MRELSQIRDAVVSALAAEGVAALDAYPDQRARRYGCPVAAVAVETAESRTVGFCNYLGEVFDAGTGAPRELYGKQLEAVISVEIRGQRAADCEQGCETAAPAHVLRVKAKVLVRLLYRHIHQGHATPEGLIDFCNLLSGYFFGLALKFNRNARVEEEDFVSRNY